MWRFLVGVFSDAVEFLGCFALMLYFLGWAFSDFVAVVFFCFWHFVEFCQFVPLPICKI